MFLLAGEYGLVYDFFPFTGSIPAVGRPGVPDLGASLCDVCVMLLMVTSLDLYLLIALYCDIFSL